MQWLNQAAQHYWNWNLSYAAVEGGATGAAGIFGLAADIPALFTIVIRLIQQISVCYGYDPTKPEERDYILSGQEDHFNIALLLLAEIEVITAGSVILDKVPPFIVWSR